MKHRERNKNSNEIGDDENKMNRMSLKMIDKASEKFRSLITSFDLVCKELQRKKK